MNFNIAKIEMTKFVWLQIVLIISFIALSHSVAQGFFVITIEEKNHPSIFLNLKEGSESSVHRFLLIDEGKDPSGCKITNQLARDYGELLFYFDKIEIPEVVARSSGQIKTQEMDIDSLLYANLRISQLIDECEGLKKRSIAVLEGLDVPYLQQYVDLDKEIGNKSENINDNLNRLLSRTNLSVGSGISLKGELNRKQIDPDFQFRQFYNKKPLFNQSFQVTNYQVNNATNKGSPSDMDSIKDQSDDDVQVEGLQRIRYGANKNEKLPWPFPLLFSIFEYLRNNKIEAIIYFLILTWGVHFVFRVFKHSK